MLDISLAVPQHHNRILPRVNEAAEVLEGSGACENRSGEVLLATLYHTAGDYGFYVGDIEVVVGNFLCIVPQKPGSDVVDTQKTCEGTVVIDGKGGGMALVVGLYEIVYGLLCLHLLVGKEHYVADLGSDIPHVGRSFNSEEGELLLHTFAHMGTPHRMVSVAGICHVLENCVAVSRADTVEVGIPVTGYVNVLHVLYCITKRGLRHSQKIIKAL